MTTLKKPAAIKKGFSRNKLKYSVNEYFFDIWTPQMAYVLGFTYADGNIHRTTLSWDIQKGDINILRKIKKALQASYPIKLTKRFSYRLRISNQILVKGAIERGLLPKKNIRNEIPKIPVELLRHFIRGYMDGDGWIVIRKVTSNNGEVDVGFAGANKEFLELINKIICQNLSVKSGNVRNKIKITPQKVRSICYQLEYYSSTAFHIAEWLYENINQADLYLERKYKRFLIAKKLYSYLLSNTKKARIVERKFGLDLKDLLSNYCLVRKYNGVEIAKKIGVHSSSVYRWLAKTGVKYPSKRIYG
jgi:hypothetical protein